MPAVPHHQNPWGGNPNEWEDSARRLNLIRQLYREGLINFSTPTEAPSYYMPVENIPGAAPNPPQPIPWNWHSAPGRRLQALEALPPEEAAQYDRGPITADLERQDREAHHRMLQARNRREHFARNRNVSLAPQRVVEPPRGERNLLEDQERRMLAARQRRSHFARNRNVSLMPQRVAEPSMGVRNLFEMPARREEAVQMPVQAAEAPVLMPRNERLAETPLDRKVRENPQRINRSPDWLRWWYSSTAPPIDSVRAAAPGIPENVIRAAQEQT